MRLPARVSFRDWTKLPNEAIFPANPNKLNLLPPVKTKPPSGRREASLQALREILYPALTIGIRCATGGRAGKSVYDVF